MKKSKEIILIVDDSKETLELIKRNLSSKNYNVFTASSVDSAINILESSKIDLVITDLKMPGINGLDLVRHVRENYKEIEIMMITGYPTVDSAVKAVKLGAEVYLTKPFTDDELFTIVEKVLAKQKMKTSKKKETKKVIALTHEIIGESKVINDVLKNVKKATTTIATVLITGESGTGKELVARAIHYNSSRASFRFVPVNCGGIPEGLLESELFGYVKGSFTGANETRAGFFQTADGGTIFLDEISETSLSMQVKLLRVLQNKEVCMIGSRKSQKVNVRIIAATNKDLSMLIKKNLFREDLFFRLNVINIQIPPLRDRDNDIISLVHHFAEKFAREHGVVIPTFSDNALKVLKKYYWPGNVRELENVIQRIIVMSEQSRIDVPDLPDLMHFYALREKRLNRTLEEVEVEYIRNVLNSQNGNKTKTAAVLGIDRKTLREKLKKFKIQD